MIRIITCGHLGYIADAKEPGDGFVIEERFNPEGLAYLLNRGCLFNMPDGLVFSKRAAWNKITERVICDIEKLVDREDKKARRRNRGK